MLGLIVQIFIVIPFIFHGFKYTLLTDSCQNERFYYEERPMGIILCADKDHDDIEYLEMDKTGIHVAQYLCACLDLFDRIH